MNIIYLSFLAVLAGINCFEQVGYETGKRQQNTERKEKPAAIFNTITPDNDFNLLLNSPTETSVSVSVLLKKGGYFFIEYNGMKTDVFKAEADMPQNIELKSLFQRSDTVRYRLYYRMESSERFVSSDEYRFRKYAPDDPFSFTVTADPHLDENCEVAVYEQTLRKIAEQNPAFHIDLGDTFMVDKYREDYKQSYAHYLAQRYYFGLISNEAPLYLVQGNHDGENAESKRGMTAWAREKRELFFPSSFARNHYSFLWGNTQIIVLDPFGFTTRSGMDDPWQRTLGKEQYDWLEQTLSASKAEHKMIFVHNLVGGRDIKGKFRGGSEAAPYYEWGGYAESGKYEFDSKRNGWAMPIHDLLKKYDVKIVMHGHDHVYANQDYEGVKYLCVPQPGMKNKPGNIAYAREYGYLSGTLKNNPGFIHVIISAKEVRVDYIDTNGVVLDSFCI